MPRLRQTPDYVGVESAGSSALIRSNWRNVLDGLRGIHSHRLGAIWSRADAQIASQRPTRRSRADQVDAPSFLELYVLHTCRIAHSAHRGLAGRQIR